MHTCHHQLNRRVPTQCNLSSELASGRPPQCRRNDSQWQFREHSLTHKHASTQHRQKNVANNERIFHILQLLSCCFHNGRWHCSTNAAASAVGRPFRPTRLNMATGCRDRELEEMGRVMDLSKHHGNGAADVGTADKMVALSKQLDADAAASQAGDTATPASTQAAKSETPNASTWQSGDFVIAQLRDELIPPHEYDTFVLFVKKLAAEPIYTNQEYQKRYQAIRKQLRICPRKSQLNFVYRTLLLDGQVESNEGLEDALVAKNVRSLSGVLVITVFTSAYPTYVVGGKLKKQSFSCKHNCYYCPNEPGLPRSYLSEEPGVARGKRHNWDPVDQFYARAWTYFLNGHPIDKVGANA